MHFPHSSSYPLSYEACGTATTCVICEYIRLSAFALMLLKAGLAWTADRHFFFPGGRFITSQCVWLAFILWQVNLSTNLLFTWKRKSFNPTSIPEWSPAKSFFWSTEYLQALIWFSQKWETWQEIWGSNFWVGEGYFYFFLEWEGIALHVPEESQHSVLKSIFYEKSIFTSVACISSFMHPIT